MKLLAMKAALAILLLMPPLAQAQAALLYTRTDFGTLGGTNSLATGINGSGQVVGAADTPGNASSHAFISAPNGGALSELGTLGGR